MIKKRLKNILYIILCLLIQLNVFASIVSDNDGSAFVTKSEFEAMKDNFASQINDYNSSIDEKIDGAISSYLAGVQLLKKTNIDGFVEVSGTKPQIYGRKKDYETISKQFWNDLTCNITCFGTASSTAKSYIPFESNSNGGVTDNGQYMYWCLKVQSAKSPWANMQGYKFNTDGVVTGIYNSDQLVISISDTQCADTWGAGMGVLANVERSTFTSNTFETGKLYTNQLTFPTHRWSQNHYTDSSSTIITNYANWLYDVETGEKTVGYASMEDVGTLNLANTFYAEHVATNEVNGYINIYNEVDAIIYAYPEGANKIETFCDPLSTYDKSANGRRWQLALYTKDDSYRQNKLSGFSWWNYDGRGNTVNHRYGLYVPKLKLKNDTTIDNLKPVYRATDDTGNKFNNLNQFRNGYMTYTDKDGNKRHPYFYGGVPLFNMDNLTEKVSFKIKVNATTSGVNKIRIWVKNGEFPNANYNATSSAWTAIDPMTGQSYNDDLVKGLKLNDVESTEKYVDIAAGTVVTIEVDEPQTKRPYFLRFAEVDTSGNCLNSGGKITSLTDFVAYTS